MQKSLYTYNGNQINDGTNFEAWILAEQPLQPAVNQIAVERTDNWPVYAGKQLRESNLVIQIKCKGTLHSQVETVKGYFDVADKEQHKLVIKDTSNSDKQWYIYATPLAMPEVDGQTVTVTLGVTDPAWRSEDTASVTWAIAASGDTKSISVGGNIYTRPKFEITPTTIKSANGYAYKRFVTVYNKTDNPYINYPLNLTDDGTGDGVLDTAALGTAGKMQTSGNDLRVMVDGVEVNRWIGGVNSTTTRVWANISLQPKIELLLAKEIANTGAVSSIDFRATSGYKALLRRLPSAGIGLIDSELFTWTEKDEVARRLSGITRAVKQTSAATHSVSAKFKWIEHDIWIMYGNSTSEAPVIDNSTEPIINEATSHNQSWIYENFADSATNRAGSWSGVLISTVGGESDIYTATQDTEADPASVMGASVKSWQRLGRWQNETAKLIWSIYQPAGMTHIDSKGNKYKTSGWPSMVKVQKSKDGSKWYLVNTIASPTTASTWTAFDNTNTALSGTYNFARFIMNGSVTAVSGNYAYCEITDVTLTLDANKIPYAKMAAEESNYYLDATITNQTTGEWLKITAPMNLNDTMTVDSDNYTITNDDGTNILGARTLSSRRQEWLKLNAGANVLEWTDAGTAAVTCVIKYQDRNN